MSERSGRARGAGAGNSDRGDEMADVLGVAGALRTVDGAAQAASLVASTPEAV